jgi:FkbM family methyltransferase
MGKVHNMNTLKSLVRHTVEAFVNPHRINDTFLYQSYVRLRYPRHYRHKQEELAFYREIISQSGQDLVVDIGANCGGKAILFSKVAQRVVCVEPSPLAVNILKQRFAHSPNVVIIGKGVGARTGNLPFHIFGEKDCHNTFSSKWTDLLADETTRGHELKAPAAVVDVPITTLDAIIAEFGMPAYIKIDVEGFEAEVLRGLSHSVKCVSIECNLPAFVDETLGCLARLEAINPATEFNYCITEPPTTFVSDRWLSRAEMADVVASRQLPYMEIYSRCHSAS